MRRTVNVGHRDAQFTLVNFQHPCCSWGFGKPGDRLQQVLLCQPRGQKQPSQRVSRRSGSPGLVTQLRACLPCSDVAGPLGRAHFFLCQTCAPPLLRSSSVHLGLFLGHLLWQGLTAGELVEGPPVSHGSPSLLHPAAAGPVSAAPTQLLHVPPSFHGGPRAQYKSIFVFPPQLCYSAPSVDALSNFPLGSQDCFSSSSCISPPRPPQLFLWKWGFRDSDSREPRFVPTSQEMAT